MLNFKDILSVRKMSQKVSDTYVSSRNKFNPESLAGSKDKLE
jgi:hypothetical protein